MTILLVTLAMLLVFSASAAGMLIFRSRARGVRLFALAPVPLAVLVGVFAAAYFAVYASDYVAVAVFVLLLAIAAWLAGFIFCMLLEVIRRLT